MSVESEAVTRNADHAEFVPSWFRRRTWLQFSVKTMLLLILVLSLPAAYYSNNVAHWRAIKVLRANNVEIIFCAENPSWIDSRLGDYRLDEVLSLQVNQMRVGSTNESNAVVSAISNLRSLEEFSVSSLRIEDIESYDFLAPISGTLKTIELGRCVELNEPFFSQFTRVHTMTLIEDEDEVVDCAIFSGMTELRSFTIQFGKLENIGMLSQLTAFSIEWTSFDIGELDQFKNLDHFGIYHSRIDSIAAVAEMENLHSLFISHTNVTDFSPICHLDNLVILHGNSNPVVSMPRLKCKSLMVAEFSQTLVSDISVFQDLPNLQRLSLSIPDNAQTQSLSDLGDLPSLIHLSVRLPTMQELSIVGCQKLQLIAFYDTVFAAGALDGLRRLRPEIELEFVYGIRQVNSPHILEE